MAFKHYHGPMAAPQGLQGLDANLLRYLLALLEHGHVRQAAEGVGLSQSGMSRALARLREHFADPLFISTGRGLRPTPFALSLRPALRSAFAELDRLASARADFDAGRSRRHFRIASADYSALLLLSPLQSVLAQRAPNISLSVRPVAEAMSDGLALDAFDLMLGPALGQRPSTLSTRLYTEDFCVVAAPEHPILKAPLTLRAYAEAVHVLVAPGGQAGSLMDDALHAHQLERRVAVTVSGFLSVPSFVCGGKLIATLPRRLALYCEQAWGLRLVELPIESPVFAVSMSFGADRAQDPAHRWLRQRIVQIAREPQASEAAGPR